MRSLLEIGLHELRERTGVTQTAIAERMETSRPNVHRIEHEDDIRLSTLERYVRAAGGVLHIEAVMPDGESIALLGSAVEAAGDRGGETVEDAERSATGRTTRRRSA